MSMDYAARVDSYICQHDGTLGPELTLAMRRVLRQESPLTHEDSERWIYSIDRHVEAKKKINS
jgi:hypothetical protein